MVLALVGASITMKDLPRRILYSLSYFSSRFCDQKHHLASHLIQRAWWRGSDPFPGVSARKNVAKRRKSTFERLHKRENDEERCHDRFCVRNIRCRSLYKLKSSDRNYDKTQSGGYYISLKETICISEDKQPAFKYA
jgi:hypothetical protein